MELTVTNRSRAYPGRSSEDSKVDEVQYVVLKVCYLCTSGSVVEYRLAKARVAGSNPVSCSQRDRKKSHPMDGSFFYVQALPGSNGSNVSAPVVAGERPPDVLRRLVLSMIQKRDIRWMALFCMFEPSRARTVRMSPLHCGRSNNFKCL